ncbi:MAG: hypothetical protein K5705_13765 [Oscillospiraceae bacterium]|nr:hypothetical protein [Oscillospiraceae bacterium]
MKKAYLPLLCAMLLIGGMVGAADIFQNNEIIFPEIAAIAAGALLTPQLAWRTDDLHTFAAITVCAALGLGIVLWLPGAVWLQMSIAYLLASVLFLLSRTSFAPMISAAVLPVLLQTESVVYLIAACILTAGILCVRRILVRNGILTETAFEKAPLPDKSSIFQAVIRWLIASAVIFTALHWNVRFTAAPPLLVAFTEFWKPAAVSRKRPFAVISLLSLCAACGAGIRFLFCERFGIPACIAAMLTVLTVYGIMKALRLMLPPAAAIAILAFLIPAEALLVFPLQILLGISVLVGASFLYSEQAAQRTIRNGRRLVHAFHK